MLTGTYLSPSSIVGVNYYFYVIKLSLTCLYSLVFSGCWRGGGILTSRNWLTVCKKKNRQGHFWGQCPPGTAPTGVIKCNTWNHSSSPSCLWGFTPDLSHECPHVSTQLHTSATHSPSQVCAARTIRTWGCVTAVFHNMSVTGPTCRLWESTGWHDTSCSNWSSPLFCVCVSVSVSYLSASETQPQRFSLRDSASETQRLRDSVCPLLSPPVPELPAQPLWHVRPREGSRRPRHEWSWERIKVNGSLCHQPRPHTHWYTRTQTHTHTHTVRVWVCSGCVSALLSLYDTKIVCVSKDGSLHWGGKTPVLFFLQM